MILEKPPNLCLEINIFEFPKKSCQNQNSQLAWQLAFIARQSRDNAAVQPTCVLVDNDLQSGLPRLANQTSHNS